MNQDILCSWLGLAGKNWPPDAYALLGVPAGETDVARIEQSVHERLCRLRCYQISHPEEATEGMNRLAQAFIQVTDSLSRVNGQRAKPVTVAVCSLPRCGQKAASPLPVRKREPSKEDTVVERTTEIDWRSAPPPVRGGAASDLDTVDDQPTEEIGVASPRDVAAPDEPPHDLPPLPAPVIEPAPCISPAEEAVRLAWHSPEARLKRGTVPALVERITQTRQAALAWKHVGKYIRNPKRRLTKPAEESDLTHRMDYLFDVMEDYPAFVGHPGKPGYRVVAMARLEMTALMFKTLDERQREELARDWEAGERVLREHRRFLLKQLKTMKKRDAVDRVLSAAGHFIRVHKLWFALGGAAFIAGCIYLLSR